MDYTKGLSEEDIKKYQRGDTFGKKDRERYDRAQDFKNQKVKDVKKFNYDQHNRKGVEGTHVSGQEARFVAKEGGREAAYESLKAQKDAGATFGKRAQAKFDRMGERLAARNNRQAAKEKAQAAKEAQKHVGTPTDEAPSNPQTPVSPQVEPSNNNQTATNTGDIEQKTDIKHQQSQDVTQDNDVNSTINGNNNTSVINQDNSVRQYGGDQRTMVINEANTGNQSGSGSSGGYYNAADKAITMGTLGGFYDVDDSPAARASFVDQSVTMNRDNQKRFAGMGLATAAQFSNFDPGVIDRTALDQSIRGDQQNWFDMAKVQEVKTYGDRDAQTEFVPFNLGGPLEDITSNADEIAEGYKDDIDDM